MVNAKLERSENVGGAIGLDEAIVAEAILDRELP